jgi:hypothetical protein
MDGRLPLERDATKVEDASVLGLAEPTCATSTDQQRNVSSGSNRNRGPR